jgi:hypothetical protein
VLRRVARTDLSVAEGHGVKGQVVRGPVCALVLVFKLVESVGEALAIKENVECSSVHQQGSPTPMSIQTASVFESLVFCASQSGRARRQASLLGRVPPGASSYVWRIEGLWATTTPTVEGRVIPKRSAASPPMFLGGG